jgi:chromosome partitioning protein
MHVLGMLSRKGGSGKTTLATTLAVLGEQAGLRTLLVDLDPQGSSAAWWKARDALTPPLVETQPGRLKEILAGAEGDGIDLVVVDARPSVEDDVAHVASLASLVLVPTRPAVFDLRAILGTLDIVRTAACRAMIVLNGCPPPRGAGEASVVVDARHALAAFGVAVAPTAIVYRSAFPAAALAGLAVVELDPDGKAAKETRALWRIVEKELNQHDSKANASGRAGGKAQRSGSGRAANGAGAGQEEAGRFRGSRHKGNNDQAAHGSTQRPEGNGGGEARPGQQSAD